MLKRPSKQDYVSAEHYASALQIYIDVKESALQSQIDRLTKERDEARGVAKHWRDDVCQGTIKFPWEDKTDE